MRFDDLDIEKLRARRGEKWATYPPDILPVWVADMDFPPAEPIQDVLRHALDCADTGYPLNPRPVDLPTVFAERVKARFDWSVDPECVEIITDVVQGIYIGLEVFSEPGDGVIVQTPVYPPFLEAVHDMGRRMLTNELVRGASQYEIDFDALEASIDKGTRMLLLCNPQNPTGRVFTRSELERIAELVLANHLTVISDEIHAELVYPDHRHIPLASLSPEIEAHTVTLMSATKAFNIAGLRCSVAAFGSEILHEQFNTLHRNIRGGIGNLGLWATEAAWLHCQDWHDAALHYLDGNRRFLADYLAAQIPAIQHHVPEATYLAWLDCRALELDRSPYWYFLKHGKVALTHGKLFGPGGEGFVRLNFATSRTILTEALERMNKALGT